VAAVGGLPRAIDVDPETGCISSELVDAGRTTRTKAVVLVHLYGYPAELPETDLLVIEDAAQAHGALRDAGRSAATAYSFYPTKNLGGIGDGGAVVTARADIADCVRTLRVHGMTAQYVHEHVSQNFRMSELEAAWLRLALPSLTADIDRRRAVARRYREAAPHLRWQRAEAQHVYHLAVFRTADRTRARACLESAGVATAIHYPLAITQQPAYRDLEHACCAEAELWSAECISVPCFPELTEGEIDTVCNALAALER
jgi:dTDP-4-amino-4,6-dideoxygalactose transaminase